jgi:hypothetical protein
MTLEKNKGNTTKGTKEPILWRPTNEMLKWSDTMESGGGLNVHKINNSKDNFNPDLRRNRGGK